MTDQSAPAVRRRPRRRLALGTAVLTVLAFVAMTAGPARADVDSVAGTATALTIAGTAPSPTVSGSAAEPVDGYGPIGSGLLASGANCPSPGLVPGPLAIGVGLLEACTQGAGVATNNEALGHLGFSESSASAADVVLGTTALGVVSSQCRADGNGARGSTTIVGSSGLPTNPTPGFVPPSLPLGVVSLVLNEQIVQNTPGVARITVNAVRATLLGGIEVIIGQSTCEALGPNVNVVTTVPPTTVPPGATTVPPGATTVPPGATTVPPGATTVPPGATTVPPGVTTTRPAGVTTTRPAGVPTTACPPAQTACPTATTRPCPPATACPATTPRTGALVRTGSDSDLMMAWSAMALTLGGLFFMGAKGLPGQPAPSSASGRGPAPQGDGRRRSRREVARDVFREMRRFK